jgi:hypothetical protein
VALATHCEALESFAEEHREESQRAASLERIAASIGAIAAAVGEKDRFLLEPLKRLARAQAALGRLPEAESTIDKALEVVGSLPEAQVTALELRSIRRSLRASRGLFTPEVEVSGLPPAQPGPAPSVAQPASATSTPAADRPKAPCSGCGSMVLLDDAQRLGCCPWCGASWTGPVTTPDQSSSTGSGAPN